MNSRIRIIHIIVVKRKLTLLKCLIIPIVAVLDYGALDVMKQLGLQNKIVSMQKVKEIHFTLLIAEFKDDKYSNLGNRSTKF